VSESVPAASPALSSELRPPGPRALPRRTRKAKGPAQGGSAINHRQSSLVQDRGRDQTSRQAQHKGVEPRQGWRSG